MEDLGIGTSIVKRLRRHGSLPVKVLASFEGSDPADLEPYLKDLEKLGVIEVTGENVSISNKAATAARQTE
jgi:hypothetical protein